MLAENAAEMKIATAEIKQIVVALERLANNGQTMPRNFGRRIRAALVRMKKSKSARSATGYLHVSINRSRPLKPYQVTAWADGKTRRLGNFETFEEAKEASDKFEAAKGGKLSRRHSKRDPVTGRLIAGHPDRSIAAVSA